MSDVGFTSVPFSEVADFTNGYGFGPADWGRSGLPIVRIQQLLNPYAVADLFAGSLDSRYRIDTGDLVMSWSGTIAVVEWDRGPAWLNQHLFRVNAKVGVEAAFLKHLLYSRLGHLEAASHGTTMKHIKRGDLLKHEVSLPPLEEQRRIAEILDTIDETIQATERVIAKRNRIRTGLAASLLSGRSEGVPTEDWKPSETQPPPALRGTSRNWAMSDVGFTSVPFSEVADFTNGYGFGPADWGRSGLPIVRIQQLLNPYAVADLFAGSLDSRYRIDTGDLVMSWSGTIAVVEWDRGPAWLNQHLFRVNAKVGVEAAFLKHLLYSRLGHLEAASHGTTMKHIKRGDLLKHEVSLPPLEEQRRIAEILDTIDETIQVEEAQGDKLRQLRSGLAANLLSGRVRTVAA